MNTLWYKVYLYKYAKLYSYSKVFKVKVAICFTIKASICLFFATYLESGLDGSRLNKVVQMFLSSAIFSRCSSGESQGTPDQKRYIVSSVCLSRASYQLYIFGKSPSEGAQEAYWSDAQPSQLALYDAKELQLYSLAASVWTASHQITIKKALNNNKQDSNKHKSNMIK